MRFYQRKCYQKAKLALFHCNIVPSIRKPIFHQKNWNNGGANDMLPFPYFKRTKQEKLLHIIKDSPERMQCPQFIAILLWCLTKWLEMISSRVTIVCFFCFFFLHCQYFLTQTNNFKRFYDIHWLMLEMLNNVIPNIFAKH